jgi:hypothetical protein
MNKSFIYYDDYFGEWVLVDKHIWYHTKYYTYRTLREAQIELDKLLMVL